MVMGIIAFRFHGEKFTFFDLATLSLARSDVVHVMKVDIHNIVQGHRAGSWAKWTILVFRRGLANFSNEKVRYMHFLGHISKDYIDRVNAKIESIIFTPQKNVFNMRLYILISTS